jgi:acyl-CoA synthetase (AMP-forming)/AMP-acid ligase II
VPLLVTIGADRPPGATGYDELVTNARSALKISPGRPVTWPSSGYASGTTGRPKGAMISQRALTGCVPEAFCARNAPHRFQFAEAFAALCLRFRRDLGAGPERMNASLLRRNTGSLAAFVLRYIYWAQGRVMWFVSLPVQVAMYERARFPAPH